LNAVRLPASGFGPGELSLLYIASSLAEAHRLEELLDAGGLDYLVEPGRYVGGVLFRSERVGAFFYVPAAAHALAEDLLRRNGIEPSASLPG
jgi:hypothetical protein